MSLDKKYQIPVETVKKMIKDGVISCSIARNFDVYDYFLTMKQQNPMLGNSQIISNVSTEMKLSVSTVEKIVYVFGKNCK